MRPNDADALLEKFNRKADICTALTDEDTAGDFAFYCKLADAVEDMPTVDAVPVVRCKDCKHGQPMIYRHTESPCIMCSHLGSGFFARVFNPNWFCADGERRKE